MSEDAGRDLVRIQARYRGRLGVEVGVFVAVDHLRRAGALARDEEELYVDIDEWFEERLPNPSFYGDGNSFGAVTWFKDPIPAPMAERIAALRRILTAHGVEHDVVRSTDPGEVVYEDDLQIGVVPRHRGVATPMPDGVSMGPTRAGSKRRFLRSVESADEPM